MEIWFLLRLGSNISLRLFTINLMDYELTTLTLSMVKGIGSKSIADFWNCREAPSSPSQLRKLLANGAIKRLKVAPERGDIEDLWSQAKRIVESCKEQAIHILGRAKSIPIQLQKIENPPNLLFVKGNVDILHQKSVAIIGTRQPSNFGLQSARRMAMFSSQNQWVVVSGLAEGCDTAGHEGCLDVCGKTVAVLAHGLGTTYPAVNSELSEQIVKQGGCLVSEYAPGTPPSRGTFVERDRLQSGLSKGIIVIETDVVGGTMHTVGFAKSHNRGIAVLCHPEKYKGGVKTKGNEKLIEENAAIPLTNQNDLLKYLTKLDCLSYLASSSDTQTHLDI